MTIKTKWKSVSNSKFDEATIFRLLCFIVIILAVQFIGGRLNASSYPLSDEMGAECEGVTTGEGMWWLVPLSLDRTGDSVFTVLDPDDTNCNKTDFYS